ncbi:MAG: glycosyltransferase family 25 protein [FCB group bacterium]|nr:glycosyltransferase family 25 protein [FCB group bacterium]
MHFDKAYVINVPGKSTERLHRFYKSCEQAAVQVELFPAVNGAATDITDWQRRGYLCEDFTLKMPGSLGCLLSHVTLWEKIKADPQVEIALICEDDAELKPDFLSQLHKIPWEEVPPNWDMIRLAAHRITGEPVSKHLLQLPPVRRKGVNAGTFCYLMKAASTETLKEVLIPYANHQSMDVLLKSRTERYNSYVLKKPLAREIRYRHSIRQDINQNFSSGSKFKKFVTKLTGKIFK